MGEAWELTSRQGFAVEATADVSDPPVHEVGPFRCRIGGNMRRHYEAPGEVVISCNHLENGSLQSVTGFFTNESPDWVFGGLFTEAHDRLLFNAVLTYDDEPATESHVFAVEAFEIPPNESH